MIDIISGQIIGDLEIRPYYAFFSGDGRRLTAGQYFENDVSAVAWFREKYPQAFRAGAEMRVWGDPDGSRAQVHLPIQQSEAGRFPAISEVVEVPTPCAVP